MKNLTIPAILSLLAANLAFASNPCGEPAGRSIDVDSGGLVSRTIYRYKNANTFVYSYELDLAGFTPSSEKPTDGLAYSLEVTLAESPRQPRARLAARLPQSSRSSTDAASIHRTPKTPDLERPQPPSLLTPQMATISMSGRAMSP